MLTLYFLLDPSIRISKLNQMENISGFVIDFSMMGMHCGFSGLESKYYLEATCLKNHEHKPSALGNSYTVI